MPTVKSCVKVIVVGAGFAGLTAAIECVRHGHTVTLLESFQALKPLGDIISFGHNAGRIFRNWPGIVEQLDSICTKADRLVICKFSSEEIMTQVWDDVPFERNGGKKFNGHRGEIHEILFKHALSVGVDIKLGMRVSEYFETQTEAGVVCNGERFVGDVVLAADGVRSTARKIVLGYEDKPKSSGYAVYRAWFDSDELAKNPLTAHLVNNGDTHTGWLGPDIHFLAASIKDGREFSWVCTHKDDANVEESWSAPGSIDDALRVLAGWDPAVHAMVRATPVDKLVDWKLVYRDPLPTWLSPEKRIALIGDAAHPFLPTSVQGASQAMEDGATLAVCLELSGKEKATMALKAYERIRYERVRRAQVTGETTRDKWHKADFEKVGEEPENMALPREMWLLGFDAEEHAYEVYEETVKALQTGPML
ncbi:putative monooxygenase [Saccharata proteae CBS 121410]|uniref:Monooxygenase n=1 Tax=Saccharata proteae CBS 121410 TaxID=1314787 RepID=A0A9P4HSJ2_9PEZI|nr:putative monooxygenase [Saccharata proteae CBS 121410]